MDLASVAKDSRNLTLSDSYIFLHIKLSRIRAMCVLSSSSDSAWVLLSPSSLQPSLWLLVASWPSSRDEWREGNGLCRLADFVLSFFLRDRQLSPPLLAVSATSTLFTSCCGCALSLSLSLSSSSSSCYRRWCLCCLSTSSRVLVLSAGRTSLCLCGMLRPV